MNATKHKQTWLANVERLIINQRPDLSGRLEWYDLIHLYNEAYSVQDAATRYLATR
jgi:hypothetical protein